MKFSKNSWHYKIHTIFRDDWEIDKKFKNITLCRYFWTTVFTIPLVVVAIVVYPLVFIVNFIDETKYNRRNKKIAGYIKIANEMPASKIVKYLKFRGIGVFNFEYYLRNNSVVVTNKKSAFCSTWVKKTGEIEQEYNRLAKRQSQKLAQRRLKKQSLFLSYLYAVKNKVCPIIEWEE